jgi:hypothetical protein
MILRNSRINRPLWVESGHFMECKKTKGAFKYGSNENRHLFGDIFNRNTHESTSVCYWLRFNVRKRKDLSVTFEEF